MVKTVTTVMKMPRVQTLREVTFVHANKRLLEMELTAHVSLLLKCSLNKSKPKVSSWKSSLHIKSLNHFKARQPSWKMRFLWYSRGYSYCTNAPLDTKAVLYKAKFFDKRKKNTRFFRLRGPMDNTKAAVSLKLYISGIIFGLYPIWISFIPM